VSLQSADTDISGPPDATLTQGACGTSFSSPYAMGAAALVRDYFEKGFYPTGSGSSSNAFAPTGALVKAVLLNSGTYMTCCGSFMESTATYGQGMGRLNLSNTLAIAGDARTPPGTLAIDRGMSVGLSTGETFEELIEITDASEPFRVTLNWTDRVGEALVNDLRLTVIGPAGTPAQTYHGGNFTGAFTDSEASGGTNDDGLNPFEAVFVPPADLVTGTWTVRVFGTNVPDGDGTYGNTQPFALVASGGFASGGVAEVSSAGSGTPLRPTAAAGTDVTWEWEASGDPAVAYNLYRGNLPATGGALVYDHATIDASFCALATPTATVSDRQDGLDRYYLVAMTRNGFEGTLGPGNGGDRPAASPACP